MAIREHEDYTEVDTLYDLMQHCANNGLYIQISKKYLDKDNHAFINKGYGK